MLHAMALALFSLNKTAGSLFHSLGTGGINRAAQDTSVSMVRLYVRDLINDLSLIFNYFLIYDSERKNLLL